MGTLSLLLLIWFRGKNSQLEKQVQKQIHILFWSSGLLEGLTMSKQYAAVTVWHRGSPSSFSLDPKWPEESLLWFLCGFSIDPCYMVTMLELDAGACILLSLGRKTKYWLRPALALPQTSHITFFIAPWVRSLLDSSSFALTISELNVSKYNF